jgi:radical SAM superfamily enzyme YgiQ (UPF0313 family)
VNILLVYPEFPDTFWSFKHALKFVRKKASSPPLGLLTVAAMLPKAWNKRLVDVNVSDLTDADLKWADLVFLSAMVVQRDSTRKIIARCKASGVRVVAGGPLFTCEPDQYQDVDHLILNEGEITLPLFLDDLARGRPQRVYTSTEFPDLRASPIPLWELADLDKYEAVGVQFSRGCPYNCDFCNVTALFGHRPRAKTAQQLTAELDRIYALGWRRNVFFVDDNFIGNRKLAKTEILPALIEWRRGKRGVPFITEVTVNLADDEELMRLMAEAGFTSVFVGIETPDEEGLTECHKTQNKGRDLVESVKRMQRAGIQVMGGFIVGFDSDTPSIFQRQIDFIQKSGIVTAMVGLLQAPYGTKLYERLRGEGRLRSEISGDNADGTTNIIPKMDLHVLHDGYRNLMRHLYSPDQYYARVKTFLREYKPPKIQFTLEFDEILAFFRTIYRLGIRGVERANYWRLFFWTLFTKPRAFPLAIMLAVYGFHFRKVSELHVQG